MTLNVVPAAEHVRANGGGRGVWVAAPDLTASVTQILADVRLRGDAALIDYTRRYDAPRYDVSKLRIPIPMHDRARALVPPEIADALALEKQRLTQFHQSRRPLDFTFAEGDGTRYGARTRPLDAVGAYVRRGRGSGAPGVLATVVPAKLAGVSRAIVLTPPLPQGGVHPAVLFACSLCDVDELYAVGGAHAVAAAALGTESVAPVEKIVGGGGPIVTEAKRQLYGFCEMDGLSRPPVMLVVADDDASSEYIAGELLSQAEAEPFSQICVLSESRPLLDAVSQLIDTLEGQTPAGGESVRRMIQGPCSLLHARNRRDVLKTIEALAPDVLVLHVREPQPLVDRVRHVRAVLIGERTPLAAVRSMLSTSIGDFLRTFTVLENSRERMLGDAEAHAALCDFESMPHHANAARLRHG